MIALRESMVERKIINITGKRQITIPMRFYEKLNFGKEVECVLTDDSIVIRPLSTQDNGFTMEILKDLISQGYSGDELLTELAKMEKNINKSLDILVEEADEMARRMVEISELTNNVMEAFTSGVKKILGSHLEKIVLYGSYAREDYDDSSDIDVMILTDLDDIEAEKYKEEICDFAYDLELENNVIISPLVKNINNYQKRINVVPFYMNVQKEGVVLYG